MPVQHHGAHRPDGSDLIGAWFRSPVTDLSLRPAGSLHPSEQPDRRSGSHHDKYCHACHRHSDRWRRHPQAHPLRSRDRRSGPASGPPGVPRYRSRLSGPVDLVARPRPDPGNRRGEHRFLRCDPDPGPDPGRRAGRRGQPTQPPRSTHGRQVRSPGRRTDRPRRPRAHLNGGPEDQVRDSRGHPDPTRHPSQRGQGPAPRPSTHCSG